MTAQEELGTIQINPDVIATISLMAAKEVTGIITGGSSLHDFINPRKKGIRPTHFIYVGIRATRIRQRLRLRRIRHSVC